MRCARHAREISRPTGQGLRGKPRKRGRLDEIRREPQGGRGIHGACKQHPHFPHQAVIGRPPTTDEEFVDIGVPNCGDDGLRREPCECRLNVFAGNFRVLREMRFEPGEGEVFAPRALWGCCREIGLL